MGGGWAGNSATGCLKDLALCVCAEMGVAWHILGAGEVSEP